MVKAGDTFKSKETGNDLKECKGKAAVGIDWAWRVQILDRLLIGVGEAWEDFLRRSSSLPSCPVEEVVT